MEVAEEGEGGEMKLKHEGLYLHRLSPQAENPREVAFRDEWILENTRGNGKSLLEVLISDCSQRDATVAATIIQWLGSPVGMSFLETVITKSPEVKKRLCP